MKKKGGKRPEKRANTLILSRTLFLMILCGIVAFIPLIVTLYNIQIRDHEYYENLAVEQQTGEMKVSASRGAIYDRNGNTLAMSASVETIFISPKQILEDEQNVQLIASELSRILDVSYEGVIEKAADTKSQYKTIKTKVEQETANAVRASIEAYELSGIYIVPDTKRYYPYSSLAAHVIGFVGDDNYGLEGIEALYDSQLSGKDGMIITARTGAGTEMLYKYENIFDAQSGNNLTLTIDSTIQYYLEKHLEAAVEDYDIQNGAAGIIMDVNTGEILAIASIDNFDLNNFSAITNQEVLDELENYSGEEYSKMMSEALSKQMRNKAVSDTYEPGSTFKAITLAIAIEEALVSNSSSFYCSGSMDVIGRDKPVHCWRDWGHGSQTLVEAVENSCNMAFVQMGLRIGADTFMDYVEAFGFFEKTGIDLLGESSSIWWPREDFTNSKDQSSLAVAAFGQTFNITPLQLITAVSAVANGGYLMEPYVVKEIKDGSGTVIDTREPTVVRQVISEQTSAAVCEILESVVSNGTGKGAQVPGYKIAGKTGTSEKVGQQNETDRVVSFIGFAPADDPQVAVLVLLDTPTNEPGIYISGGQMAAPTVGKIFADVLPYIGVEAVYTEDELLKIDVSVPKVTDLDLDTAISRLLEKNLNYKVVGSGDTITDQIPAAGAIVPGTASIVLYMGEAKPSAPVIVPDVYGMTVSDAKAVLEGRGLYLKITGDSGGTASKQSIVYGESVEPGAVVEVTFVDASILD